MCRGQRLLVRLGQRHLVGQAEMQRLIGIQERARGGPKARQKSRETNGCSRYTDVSFKP